MKKLIPLFLFFSALAQAKTVTVASYNTYLLPGYLFVRTNQNIRSMLIGRYFKQLDADIICLQEVFRPKYFWALERELKDKYPYNSGPAIKGWGSLLSSGLVIFSKYPISKQTFYAFKNLSNTDRFSAKGYQMVTATLDNGKKLQITNVHMQSNEGSPYDEYRRVQLGLIKKTALEKYKLPGVPMIVAGDFNIHKDSREFLNMQQILGATDFSFTGELQATYYPANNTFLRNREDQVSYSYDYVYLYGSEKEEVVERELLRPKYFNTSRPRLFNPELDVRMRDDHRLNSLSDHYGVKATISIY